jgi:pimeloyl-ACP methyl ester carboxylesterase
MLFVLVHGSWHGPWVWEHVGAVLRDRGHDVVAPALPTEELGTTWQDYADEILDAVGSRMEEAALVGHSLGAVPAAIAASSRSRSRPATHRNSKRRTTLPILLESLARLQGHVVARPGA